MLLPTKEQQNIIESAKTGTNLAIRAFAGAAKTSTCIMVAEAVTKKSLYIAFNKSIAKVNKELSEKQNSILAKINNRILNYLK